MKQEEYIIYEFVIEDMSKNFIGSIFLVSGCSMGAGALALPLLASGPGFIFSAIGLIVCGILSYAIAKISLEVFLIYKNEVNGSTVVLISFGKVGTLIFSFLNGIVMYTLLALYIAGSTDILDKTIFTLTNISFSPRLTMLIFVLISTPIFLKGVHIVVKYNKLIFIFKLICYLVALCIGLKFVVPTVFTLVVDESTYLPRAIPIFLAGLWFHFLIPVIARINDYDRLRCRRIFIYGISMPVILYILWVVVMLSLIPRTGSGNTFFNLLSHKGSVGQMINFAVHNNPQLPMIMKIAMNVFANFAMLTSFLTVGISTYDYIRDAFKIKQTKIGALNNLILTMLPSLVIAEFYPNGFVFILGQAVIILLLINLLTLMCCLKNYALFEVKPTRTFIYIVIFSIVILIGLQVADNCNLLPSFGIN